MSILYGYEGCKMRKPAKNSQVHETTLQDTFGMIVFICRFNPPECTKVVHCKTIITNICSFHANYFILCSAI